MTYLVISLVYVAGVIYFARYIRLNNAADDDVTCLLFGMLWPLGFPVKCWLVFHEGLFKRVPAYLFRGLSWLAKIVLWGIK